MTLRSSYGHGRFCWAELVTNDPEGSQSFYRQLLDWEFQGIPGKNVAIATLKGEEVAGVAWHEKGGAGVEVRVGWRSYISVSSAERTSEKVRMLHGAVSTLQAHAVGGQAILFRDPTGAEFGVWQPGERIGAQLSEEPGTICWHELESGEPRLAAEFYQGLFGWSSRSHPLEGYTVFSLGGKDEAGMITSGREAPQLFPQWLVYFMATDCEEKAATAEALGGTVLQPVMEIPGVGRSAMIRDPQGAVLALFTPRSLK